MTVCAAQRGATRALPGRDRPRETSGPSAHWQGAAPNRCPARRPRRTTMQIYINDLDGRTRTLDVDHETTAADICRGGRLLHNGSFITGTLRDANVQRDATLTVVEALRGGMPDREYNSSDEDSVTTDSNEGKEEEEDSSDYESSDDETTLPQVTTLESVLAMIPFTPDWWTPRQRSTCASICGVLGSLGRVYPSAVVSKFISTQVGGARRE